MSRFETEHARWIQHHLDLRTGERKNRLAIGHAHAEKMFAKNVWWPLRGNFDDLHPEFEVLDWRKRPYYTDFMWAPGLVRLNIEVKGFTTHVRDMDQEKYSSALNRETFLYAMGIHTISFTYRDVENRPDTCRQLLRMVLNHLESGGSPASPAILIEREAVKLAVLGAGTLRPAEVARQFGIDQKTSIKLLKRLCAKGWLKPIPRGKSQRHMQYELDRRALAYFFF